MRTIILSFIIVFTIILHPANRTVQPYRSSVGYLKVAKEVDKKDSVTYHLLDFAMTSNSSFFDPKYKRSADSAVVLAAAILNSQEFRDSLSKYSFPCKNYDGNCRLKCSDCKNDTIATGTIFDSLYREKRDSLTLILHNDGRCKSGSLGYSQEDVFTITSHFITIDCDDDSLSFAYKYAYHLCHEYMHIVGFYHYLNPKRRIRDKDIAEKTGWVAYDIIRRWKREAIYTFPPGT